MKKFKLFKLLLLGVVLITSIPQMWADEQHFDGKTYIYWYKWPSAYSTWGDSDFWIQMRNTSNVWTGWQSPADAEDGWARYLVPAGDYWNIQLKTSYGGDHYTSNGGNVSGSGQTAIWNYGTDWVDYEWHTTYFARSAYVYFDNSNNMLSNSYRYILIGRDGHPSAASGLLTLSKFDNTNLWYYGSFSWNNYEHLYFMANTGSWSDDGQTGFSASSRVTYANKNTANCAKMMDHSSRQYNLFVPNSANDETAVTTYSYSGYSSLNSTQTLNSVVKPSTSGSYSSGTAKATISMTSYALTAATTCSKQTESLSTSETTQGISACRTATTTYVVGEVNSNYTFDGFYTDASGGTRLDSSTPGTYTFTPTSTTTVYARFSEKTYNVTAVASPTAGGTVTPSSATAFGLVSGGNITATYNEGYYFTGWTGGSGTYGDDSEAETTFTPSANNQTVTANFDYTWSVKGEFPDETRFVEDHLIENIGKNASSKDTGYVEIDLPANTSIEFKVVARDANSWWSCSTHETEAEITYANNKTASGTFYQDNDNKNVILRTAGAGTYRFAWNITDKKMSIHFPPSYKVTYDANDGSGTVPTDNDYYASGTTVTAKGNSGSLSKTGYNTLAYWNTAEGGSGTDVAISTGTFSISANTTLYAKWTQTVILDDNGDYGGNGSFIATYNATGPFSITAPTREGYKVEGYYDDAEYSHKIVNADGSLNNVSGYVSGGKWVHDDATTLYAKWAEDDITVTVNAGAHGEVSTTSVTGHPETVSSIFTVTAADGYAFSHWTFSEAGKADTNYVSTGGTNNATQTFTLTTKKAITITANYVVRYGLYGSLDDAPTNTPAGMPGWAVSQDFTYSAGNYSTSVTLERPNTNYKFRILDRRDNTSWGLDSKAVISEKTNTKLASTNADAQLATAGTGSYTITVTEVDEGAHPQVYIVNPLSYQITYGIVGNGGSWTSVLDGESNAIATGQYVKNDGSITFTANLSTGYEIAGWYSNAECSTPYKSGSDGATISGEGNTVLALTVTKARTVYLKIVPVELTFEGDVDDHETEWDEADNWSPACVPTIEHDVVLTKPVLVNVADAKAKSVVIDQHSGNTGKITINPTAALVVATTVQKTTDGDNRLVTAAEDLVLESSASGTGALITGSAQENMLATVQFYSKAKNDATHGLVNQYFGIAVDSTVKTSYYGSYLRVYDDDADDWASFGSAKMAPFKAYRIMRTEDENETYEVHGKLLLPGKTGTKTLTLTKRDEAISDNMFANSWTAPIDIASLAADTSTNFVGTSATFYIFNSGSALDYETAIEGGEHDGDGAGQWTVVPVNAVKEDPSSYSGKTVIPSQQAFLVKTRGTGGTYTLTFDYGKNVYTPATSGVTINPNRAPKREMDNDLEVLNLYVKGTSGYNDHVLVYMREDFSSDYDDGWEGYKLSGSPYTPQLYAFSDAGKMAIVASNNAEGTVLGFRPGNEDNTYTFSFKHEGNDVWYLNDLKEQASTLISEDNSYTFNSVSGDSEARFVVSRTPIAHVPTAIENGGAIEGASVSKMLINGTLYIIRNGQMFTAEGQMVK